MRLISLTGICLAAFAIRAQAHPVVFVNIAISSGANDGSSWANALQGSLGLQSALNAAVAGSGTQIWVAAGRYLPAGPNGDRTISFTLKSGVGLYGGFVGTETSLDQRNPATNVTTLSGDLNGNDVNGQNMGDNSLHVVRGTNVDSACIVDGLVIRDGRASGGGAINASWGSNIFLEGGGPILRNCLITAGNSSSAGGGAALNAASPTFDHCRFMSNKAQNYGGGLVNFNAGSPVLRNCLFQLNIGGQGAGVYSGPNFVNGQLGGLMVLSDCDLIDNDGLVGFAPGPGMYIDRNLVHATRCRLIHNTTDAGGGGIFAEGDTGAPVETPVFVNCRFVGNNGAVFSNFNGSVELESCTMAHNSIGFGQFFSWPVCRASPGSTLRLKNCIVWGNQPVGGSGLSGILNGGGTIIADYCDVQSWDGSRPGVNSFAADPMFANAAGVDGQLATQDDDVHLLKGSPCIDSGNDALLPMDVNDQDGDESVAEVLPLDLDGQPRITGCRVDIGFDELFPGQAGSGDTNLDGIISIDDVPSFAAGLLNDIFDCAADLNSDQRDDGSDIPGFLSDLVQP